MPSAINPLVIKNAAGVDKNFTLLTPAAGYGSVAEWVLKEGTISSVFPRLSIMAVTTKTGQNCHVKFRMPSSFTDSVTGLTNVASQNEVNAKFSVADDFPESLKDDWIAYATNAFKTALVVACGRDGLPAT